MQIWDPTLVCIVSKLIEFFTSLLLACCLIQTVTVIHILTSSLSTLVRSVILMELTLLSWSNSKQTQKQKTKTDKQIKKRYITIYLATKIPESLQILQRYTEWLVENDGKRKLWVARTLFPLQAPASFAWLALWLADFIRWWCRVGITQW